MDKHHVYSLYMEAKLIRLNVSKMSQYLFIYINIMLMEVFLQQ